MEASDRLNLPVIRAMEMPFSSPDMGMAHQRLDRFEIVSLIQEVVAKVCRIYGNTSRYGVVGSSIALNAIR